MTYDTAFHVISRPTPSSLHRPNRSRPVVVLGVADDGVDVVGAALGGVLDHDGRALHPEVGGAYTGCNPGDAK